MAKRVFQNSGPAILILCLLFAQAATAQNIVTNPGFEPGTTGWSGFGCSISTSTSVYHSGSRSGYAYSRGGTWSGLIQSMKDKMVDGETYTITAWMRLANADSNQIAATIRKIDDDGTHYYRIDTATGRNDRWTLLAGSFTLNEVGELTDLDLYFEGPEGDINYYLDDVSVLPPDPEPDPNATGIVDVNIIYQELDGFGAAGGWYEGWLVAHPQKSQIYDVIFGQLGLDIYRIRNTYDISTNYMVDTEEIVEAAETSLGYPIKIMISSWSPPAYLKSDANTVGGTLDKYPAGGYKYAEFATWWADSLEEWSDIYGIDADYINIQNEVEYIAVWDSCKFTPTETAEWAGYDEAFEAVYQELDSRMSEPPKMLAPETANIGNCEPYIDALIDINHVYGYAHHLYGDGDFNHPDSFVPVMESFAEHCGYKPLLQTEYSSNGDYANFSGALSLAQLMHSSIVVEGVSAYLYWDLFWANGGLVTLDNPWSGNPSYTINDTYYAFKQYSAFTNPGWRRVEASTDSTGLRISAFRSPDNNEMAIIIINKSEVEISLSLSLGACSITSSAVYRTSETEHTAYIGTFSTSGPITVPEESITTISLTGDFSPNYTTCEQVLAGGYRLTSDINGDCYVDYYDLEIVAYYWLYTNCGSYANCDGADFDPTDGTVDLFDFSDFAVEWKSCNDPEDPGCTQNW